MSTTNWMLDPAVISAAYRAEVLANRTGVTENVPDKWIGINADARSYYRASFRIPPGFRANAGQAMVIRSATCSA